VRSTLWAIWLLVPDPFFKQTPFQHWTQNGSKQRKAHSLTQPTPNSRLLTQQDTRPGLGSPGMASWQGCRFSLFDPFIFALSVINEQMVTRFDAADRLPSPRLTQVWSEVLSTEPQIQ
jgi:hypothetical protein